MSAGIILSTRQQGVALVLALVLLFVMTVLGVSAYNNTHVQERSAGNARLQAVAFEAAAAGATNAINFFDANRDIGPDQLCGATGHPGWEEVNPDENPTVWVYPSEWGGGPDYIGDARLRQRMYCLADEYDCLEGGEEGVDCGVRPPRSQLFVLSRGEVTTPEGCNPEVDEDCKIVASRDVEVRLEIGSSGIPGDGCAAICFPACGTGTLDFPAANAFQVDGNGGPAITAGCESAADSILGAIGNGRIGNYDGGVAAAGPGSPWDDPLETEAFRLQVALVAAQAGNYYHPGNLTDNGNTTYGTNENPQVTYVDGNASFGGDISGAGIMFVNGTLSWNGTPNFRGLIVALGGTFQIDGGGRGGNPGTQDAGGGSIVILNHPDLGLGEFGVASFDNTGGGTGFWQHDCEWLWTAHGLLEVQVGEGNSIWSPECDTGPANPFQAGPEELIIASWRENIGWREDFFGAE